MSMSDIVRRVTVGLAAKRQFPTFHPGDTLGVYVKVREGEKERVQLYRGVVTKISGSGMGRSFTVRKISSGVGVERTFPFASPSVDRVEVISKGKIRRARLFYLRNLRGRASSIDSELNVGGADEAAPAAAPAVETPVKN